MTITQADLEAAKRDHCPAVGTGGTHSEGFYEEPDAACTYCFARSTMKLLIEQGFFDRVA